MRRVVALVASTALLGSAAAQSAPAEAAVHAPPGVAHCVKTKYGVTVHIKIRDKGDYSRVRVSHPRGKGTFYQPRVRSTRQDAGEIGRAESRDRGAAAVRSAGLPDDGAQNSPQFNIPYDGPGTAVVVHFRLTNGKRIVHACVL